MSPGSSETAVGTAGYAPRPLPSFAGLLTVLRIALERTAAIALFLLAWELAPRFGLINRTFLPPFSEVIVHGVHYAAAGKLLPQVVVSQFEFSGLGAVLPGKRGKQRTVTLSKGVTQRLTVPSHRSVTNAPPPGIGVVSYRNKKAIVAATMTNPTNTVPPTNLCVRHMATCPQT
jgi:hypothetical protein